MDMRYRYNDYTMDMLRNIDLLIIIIACNGYDLQNHTSSRLLNIDMRYRYELYTP